MLFGEKWDQSNHFRDDVQKKKSKKQDFGPLSVDPYPPTIKREVLIRDTFDLFSTPYPPYRNRDIYTNFKRDNNRSKIHFPPFSP